MFWIWTELLRGNVRFPPVNLLCLITVMALSCPMVARALAQEATAPVQDPADPAPDSTALAADNKLPRKYHPWAHFQPEAWCEVRVVTKTLDEDGVVTTTSTTTTISRLVEIDDDGYTLEISRTMEVAGKVLDHGPELVWRGDTLRKRERLLRRARTDRERWSLTESRCPATCMKSKP